MDTKSLEEYITKFFGYKSKCIVVNNEEYSIDVTLYDSFVVTFGLNKVDNLFYGKLHLPYGFTSSYFLGYNCKDIKNTEANIKNALEKVDDFCRTRLTPSFLSYYDESFSSNSSI